MTSSAGHGDHFGAAANHLMAATRRARRVILGLRSHFQSVEESTRSLSAIGVVAIVVGVIFGVWPQFDLRVSALFYDAAHHDWPWAREPVILAIRDFNEFITRAIIAAAIIALIFAAAGARAVAIMTPRTAIFLLTVLATAPGLIANGIFKAHWGRPRPGQVTAFGGTLDFVPWWSPSGECGSNCSFFSGEAAGAFCLIALAVVLPARCRTAGVALAIAWGLTVSFVRVAMGGHFPSDVLFAGLFTALAIWLLHRIFFRRAAATPGAKSPPPTRW